MNFSYSKWLKGLNPFQFVFIHVSSLAFVYLLLKFLGVVHDLPKANGIYFWDAAWYNQISLLGYHYSGTGQSNSAFYPLFPYLWRLTGFQLAGISILNATLGLVSIWRLSVNFKWELSESLLYLSFPSMFFLYVPYSESCFFFFTALFLIGLSQENKWLISIGLILASVTRASAIFFIPAFFFMEILSVERSQISRVKLKRNLCLYLACVCIGMVIVTVVQYIDTGIWFVYYKAQMAGWPRTLQIPGFPLRTWDNYRVIWIDGIAAFIGVVACFVSLKTFFSWIVVRPAGMVPDKAYLFSICYLSLAFGSILFFNPKDIEGSTHVFVMNRHIIAAPFLGIFLHKHFLERKLNLLYLTFFTLSAIGIWLLFADFKTLFESYYFSTLSVYVFVFLLMFVSKSFSNLWIPNYCLNLIMQVWLFDSFYQGLFIG